MVIADGDAAKAVRALHQAFKLMALAYLSSLSRGHRGIERLRLRFCPDWIAPVRGTTPLDTVERWAVLTVVSNPK
jgi:hypothetical protein